MDEETGKEASLLLNSESSKIDSRNGHSSRVFDEIQNFRRASLREKSSNNRNESKKHYWQILLFGQAIALASASTNASSFTMISSLGITLPLFQTAITYALLSLHLWYQYRRQEEERKAQEIDLYNDEEPGDNSQSDTLPFTRLRLKVPWWIYCGIAFLDVESNYLVLLSFRYTSLTSTTLLLSLTTPSTMLVSCYMLARVFTTRHHVGVCLCLLGGTMTVWSDLGGTGRSSAIAQPNHSYVGDLLAIAGALMYGLTDTVAEYSIKRIDRVEYLGMLGLFGALIGGIQFSLTEWSELATLITEMPPDMQLQALAVMVWYIASLWLYYVCASLFLTTADATLLNLSLQTSQLWAILFTVIAERVIPRPLFFAAVVLVVTGVFVYKTGPTKEVTATAEEEDNDDAEEVSEISQRSRLYGSIETVS